jgi:hypothetical protein
MNKEQFQKIVDDILLDIASDDEIAEIIDDNPEVATTIIIKSIKSTINNLTKNHVQFIKKYD